MVCSSLSDPRRSLPILTLLTQKNLERMAHAARQKALESFDEERVFAVVKAAYAVFSWPKRYGTAACRWHIPKFGRASIPTR